eukprot:3449845-Rhodomonas_salina.2
MRCPVCDPGAKYALSVTDAVPHRPYALGMRCLVLTGLSAYALAPRCPVLTDGNCYAKPGTEIALCCPQARRRLCYPQARRGQDHVIRSSPLSSYALATPCPVLTQRMP